MKITLTIDNPKVIKDDIKFYEIQTNTDICNFTSMALIIIRFSHKGVKGTFIRKALCLRDDTGYCIDCEVLPSADNADGYIVSALNNKPIYLKKYYIGNTDDKFQEFCTHLIQSCVTTSSNY